MGDRRISDRRSPEKGVIKIPLKHAIVYIILAAIIIISVSANIVLGKLYSDYKNTYENLVGTGTEDFYDFDEDESYIDDEIDDDDEGETQESDDLLE